MAKRTPSSDLAVTISSIVSLAKMAEPTEILLTVQTPVGPMNRVPDKLHLANTTKQSVHVSTRSFDKLL